MTIINHRFTPEALISAPRRSSAVPNANGTQAIYTLTKYHIQDHHLATEIRILNLENGQSFVFTHDETVKGLTWLDSDRLLWAKKLEDGTSQLWIGRSQCEGYKAAYLAGSIPAPIESFKVKPLERESFGIAFIAQTTASGGLHNPVSAPKSNSSAREYHKGVARYWDRYLPPQKLSLFYTFMSLSSDSKVQVTGTYFNVLLNSGLEFPVSDPDFNQKVPFDISSKSLIFVALKSKGDDRQRTTTRPYVVSLDRGYSNPPSSGPSNITPADFDGPASSPILSLDGSTASFLIQKTPYGASGRNHIFCLVPSKDLPQPSELLLKAENGETWDLSPESIKWANSNDELYLVAEEEARSRLFKIELGDLLRSDKPSVYIPVRLTSNGSVLGVHMTSASPKERRLFLNTSSFVEISNFEMLCTASQRSTSVSSLSDRGSKFGLSQSQIGEFYFKGNDGHNVHSWIIKPSFFEQGKTYPLAFIVHGGPVSAWTENWSTRWNLPVFAEQGYIVVAPNPTGSTGFGQDFVDAIRGEWGHKCYIDLVKCFEHVKENMLFVDTTRAVALGASFGGYMMNWIAGQPFAKKFKTLVVHDGIWSLSTLYASDIPSTLKQERWGDLWDNQTHWDRSDPSRFTKNWTQPMLVIHSDNDYRCNISHGLATYNVCQQKGIESCFLNFPNENHFVLKHENSLYWHRTVLGWINRFADVEGTLH